MDRLSKPKAISPPPAEDVPSNVQESLKEKEKGNEAYKSRNFELAHQHYDKAFELDPTNITFPNCKAALYMEQKNYDKCREFSRKMIEVGQENGVGFDIICKSLGRLGTFLKENNCAKTVDEFHKSLTEHRTKDVLKKQHQIVTVVVNGLHIYIDPNRIYRPQDYEWLGLRW